MDFSDILHRRYACKSFSEKTINEKDLRFVLESGVLAPSSFGFEPWKFVVINKKEDNLALSQICYHQENVATASVNIIICARTELKSSDSFAQKQVRRLAKDEEHFQRTLKIYTSRTDSMNADELYHYAQLQCYLAGMQMSIAAMHKGIDSCLIGGFEQQKVDSMINLQAPFQTALILSLGYEKEPNKHKKLRLDFDEVVEFYSK
ncbi:MAG: nitroreductase family protein [Helicobacter trogontum]|uniref:nitroreductase family protein n=1 Tax=Helicobacter trogontum TaxID=50960 RepID=UPI00242BABAB|nr:nitroreductase family protein [Helicobacter trogontum]MCI5787388.1 nitroreductase family protein [Helicobacter trogontum]